MKDPAKKGRDAIARAVRTLRIPGVRLVDGDDAAPPPCSSCGRGPGPHVCPLPPSCSASVDAVGYRPCSLLAGHPGPHEPHETHPADDLDPDGGYLDPPA